MKIYILFYIILKNVLGLCISRYEWSSLAPLPLVLIESLCLAENLLKRKM